jgi:hypothetical protein
MKPDEFREKRGGVKKHRLGEIFCTHKPATCPAQPPRELREGKQLKL